MKYIQKHHTTPLLRSCLITLLVMISTSVWAQYEETVTIETDVADTSLENDSAYIGIDETLPWNEIIHQRISGLLNNKMFETSQVGLMVYDLTADTIVFAHRERQLMRPASTQKMVTAVAALDLLGSDYQLKTRLCYTGDIANRTLEGNLYCIGALDPMFDNANMQSLINAVREAGIDTIRGKIIADQTMKDSNRLGEGWCWDDKNPTLTPLLVNRKDQFIDVFYSQLAQAGIYLDTNTDEGTTPASAKELITVSHTLTQVLDRMMKKSDNLYAEAVFYQIANYQGGRNASAKHAATVIRQLINKIGLDASNYKIADGSGLSLYNYISAEAEVALLKYAWQQSEIYYPLLNSMPIAGIDGTLENRMKGTRASGNVRAKTGTVMAVSSLTGYCTAANGHELAFSIINNGLLSASKGRAFQDKVCKALCE